MQYIIKSVITSPSIKINFHNIIVIVQLHNCMHNNKYLGTLNWVQHKCMYHFDVNMVDIEVDHV